MILFPRESLEISKRVAAVSESATTRGPTLRALGGVDSTPLSGIFLTSSFSCSQALSIPTPLPITQSIGQSNPGDTNDAW